MGDINADVNNNHPESIFFDSGDDDYLPNSQFSVDSIRFESDDEIAEDDDSKVFNDPIHGHILLHPLLVKIIDTPQFQRLRNVKQLGSSYLVYPGASHNRFEHCIGTSHLAGKVARLIRENQKKLEVTEKDVLCVQMAGLCHDLGHGPYSHMFDQQFLKIVRPDSRWAHEDGSCMMLDHLIESNDLTPVLRKYGIDDVDITFVKEMIAGPGVDTPSVGTNGMKDSWAYKGRPEEKSFLYEIVSNERNKVDVDKWDYFARDCHHLGIRNSFDHNRFMQFIRVLRVEGGRLQICARDKECPNLYEMFHTRSVLHRRAYQHRVSKAIDVMLCEAMVIADPHVEMVGKNGTKIRISESVDDPVAFTKLTDDIFNQMLHSTKDEMKPCRDILSRILTRKLYQCIGTTRLPIEHEIAESKIVKDIVFFDKNGELNDDDLKVSKTKFNYGMKDKNPIDAFMFFSKKNPRKPHHIRKEDVSRMLPEVFEEHKIHVFCKENSKVAVGRECFKSWCEDNAYQSNASDLTPMRMQDQPVKFTGNKRRKLAFE